MGHDVLYHDPLLYAWEDDVLVPLWALLHGQIDKSLVNDSWAQLALIPAMYAVNQQQYWDVPLTRYGNLQDLAAHYLVLPSSEDFMDTLLNNAVQAQAEFAHKKHLPGLAGRGLGKDGQVKQSGIESLAMQAAQMDALRPSVVASVLANVDHPNEARAWLGRSYAQLWPTSMTLIKEPALVGAVLRHSFKSGVKRYFNQKHLWSKYQQLWLQKTSQSQKNKAGQTIIPVEQELPKPSVRSFFREDVAWWHQKPLPVMDMIETWAIDKPSGDNEVTIEQKAGHLDIHYRIHKPVTIHLFLNQGSLLPWKYASLQMRYEWSSTQDLNTQWTISARDLSLSKSSERRLSEGALQWEKSSWQQLNYSWHHRQSQWYRRATHLSLVLNPRQDQSEASEGTLLLQDILLMTDVDHVSVSDPIEINQLNGARTLGFGEPVAWSDWGHWGQMENQGTFVHRNRIFGLFERWQETTQTSGMKVRSVHQHALEDPFVAVGFRLQKGLWGDLPRFIQAEAWLTQDSKQVSLSWNIDLQHVWKSTEAADGRYIVLPLSKDARFMDFKEMRILFDPVINKADIYSWLVDDVRLFTEQQYDLLDQAQRLDVYDHRHQLVHNIWASVVGLNEEPQWTRKGEGILFPEYVGAEYVFQMALYPGQHIRGDKLVIQSSSQAWPDGFFRLKLYHNRELILDRDVHLQHGPDATLVELHLPQSVQGQTVNRIEVSAVRGHVEIPAMYLQS